MGFLLEVAYARLTGSAKRDRKCLLLLPLCPVYGVGALLIRLLAGGGGIFRVMIAGFLAATAAELALGLFYRHGLGVEFWNYRRLKWNIAGVVCLRFSLYWMVLALILVYGADPLVEPLLSRIPAILGPPAAILLGADALVSAVALRRSKTTDILRWYC